MKILKIIFKVIGLLILIPILVLGGILIYDSYYEFKFINIDIPENMKFEKPKQELANFNLNSLNENKIEVTGNGNLGYNFYMWHKPIEEGEIYISATELTQNIKLSEHELQNRTRNIVSGISNDYILYKGESVIYEGTYEEFYPVKFEMWFKSKKTGIERKLAEKKYLIDGWDR